MDIIIGADHAGFDLKEICKTFLEKSGKYKVTDIGVFSRQSYDYPKVAHKVAQAISNGECNVGILVCGSGIGMSMVANRYKGVRAALCHNIYSARMSRLHNDANILTMGGRVTGVDLALEILEQFLKTEFEGGRHRSRVDQIDR
jgi:ribose 5-phosphate isomerase B